MKKEAKTKQIVIRFDSSSYSKIRGYAETEHRGMGEFVRHAALYYIEHFDREKRAFNKPGVNTRRTKE